MKPAFSTIAVPDWTLDQVAERCEPWGYQGLELRSFGYGSREVACDPALTAPAKTRAMFDKTGVELACLSTSLRFDEPVSPPILGRVFGDEDRFTRAAKSAIDLAAQLECPFVRVFAFEAFGSEPRTKAVRRIAGRLALAVAAARNTGVRLLLENGGSFETAAQLEEILDAVADPALGVEYNVAAAHAAGEHPAAGINVLGDALEIIKLKDYRDGKPCVLGDGHVPNREAVDAAGAGGFDGWLVYEYPRAWVPGLVEPDFAMSASARVLYDWIGRRSAPRGPRSTTPLAVR